MREEMSGEKGTEKIGHEGAQMPNLKNLDFV